MNSDFAPVVLFTFNRPIHTKMVLDALAINNESKETILYVFCDGNKNEADETNIGNVTMVREIISQEDRFKEKKIIFHDSNLGLSKSIISGVTSVINKHSKVIVLEDDILVGKGFLNYMNRALDLYENESNIGCIHGWNYSFKNLNDIYESTFFLRGADCWGWATWKRSWDFFEEDGNKLLSQIKKKKLEYLFDRNGTHAFTQMLSDQINKKNDSWAIRWHASLFLKEMFCLHPTNPIVKNIGLDGTGTHCEFNTIEQNYIDYIELEKIKIEESKWFFDLYKLEFYVKNNYQKKSDKINLIERLLLKLKKIKNQFLVQ